MTAMPEKAEGKEQGWLPIEEGLFEYPPDARGPALIGNRCTSCGKTFFPKRKICPICFDKGAMEDLRLGKRGIVYASTIVLRDSPAGIKGPYAYGYVDIPENEVRVFALFTGDEPSAFTPGREVELVVEAVRTDSSGREIIGFKFKRVP